MLDFEHACLIRGVLSPPPRRELPTRKSKPGREYAENVSGGVGWCGRCDRGVRGCYGAEWVVSDYRKRPDDLYLMLVHRRLGRGFREASLQQLVQSLQGKRQRTFRDDRLSYWLAGFQ